VSSSRIRVETSAYWRSMVFRFAQNFFFGQRQVFFQNLTLGYMTKTLNQIIFFSFHQNQNIFFSNIGNQNIFFRKKTFKLNGYCCWTWSRDDGGVHAQVINQWMDSCIPKEEGMDPQTLGVRTPLFPHLVPPAIMVWIFVWKYIFEPFIHMLRGGLWFFVSFANFFFRI
jgi:hypothetical protein